MSTPAALLAKMVQEGAIITVPMDDTTHRYVPLTAEILEAGRKRGLFWINVGAIDMGDTHILPFRELEIRHDRDLYLRGADGAPVAWITPALETPEVSTDEVREALAGHRADLTDPAIQEPFEQFAAAMRADAVRAVEES